MKKFDPYPVYINHPGPWTAERHQQLARFAPKGAAKMKWEGPTGDGTRLLEIMEDETGSSESLIYENQVHQLLRIIGSVRIGKLLLDSLDLNKQYWIVPKDNFGVDCRCQAITFPISATGGGGIRVYLTPSNHRPVQEKFESGDDILFHELVHASRIGRVGWGGLNQKRMNDYKDAEEFLAMHMQNVYLANRGATRFYRDFYSQKSVSKGTAYDYFAGDAEVLMAFRYFLDHDPVLAPTVAGWTQPADSFNPWRDQAILERIWLSDSPIKGLRHLPPF